MSAANYPFTYLREEEQEDGRAGRGSIADNWGTKGAEKLTAVKRRTKGKENKQFARKRRAALPWVVAAAAAG